MAELNRNEAGPFLRDGSGAWRSPYFTPRSGLWSKSEHRWLSLFWSLLMSWLMIPQPQDIAIDGRNRRHLTYMLSRRQALCCLGCRLLHHARCPFNPSTSFYLFCRIVPLLAPWWARLSISDWSTQLPENIFHGSIHYIPFNLLGRDSLLMIWFSRSCPSLDRCSYIYHKIATLNLCLYNNWPLPWDATYSFNLNMTSAELVNSLVLGKSELHVVGICSVQCPRISSKDCYEWNRQFHLNSMS